MKVIKDITTWRGVRKGLYGRVGFVPTMGALHDGHASLLRRSVAENAHTVLSIYVNPTQFNNAEDLDNYPDTLEADLALAESLGVDLVILPTYDELYADGYRYSVQESELSTQLCGAHRSGHFTGVLTVVMKLLNLVRADRAYFGEKDYQQYRLIRDMCSAFFMDVDIVPCPTLREDDGLAMSSRNLRLTADDRALAPQFAQILRTAGSDAEAIQRLRVAGFDVDYVETSGARRYGAATLGHGANEVRLIDNVPAAGAREAQEPSEAASDASATGEEQEHAVVAPG